MLIFAQDHGNMYLMVIIIFMFKNKVKSLSEVSCELSGLCFPYWCHMGKQKMSCGQYPFKQNKYALLECITSSQSIFRVRNYQRDINGGLIIEYIMITLHTNFTKKFVIKIVPILLFFSALFKIKSFQK